MAPSTRSTKQSKEKSPPLTKPKSAVTTAKSPNKVSKVMKTPTTTVHRINESPSKTRLDKSASSSTAVRAHKHMTSDYNDFMNVIDNNRNVRDKLSHRETRPNELTQSPKKPSPSARRSRATSRTLVAKEQSASSPSKQDLPSSIKRAKAAGKKTTFNDPVDSVHSLGEMDGMRVGLNYNGESPEHLVHEYYFPKQKLQDRERFRLWSLNQELMERAISGNIFDIEFCTSEIRRLRDKLQWKGELPQDIVHRYLYLKQRDEFRERWRTRLADKDHKETGRGERGITVPHGLEGEDLLRENEKLRKELGWTGEIPEDPVHGFSYRSAALEGREAAIGALTHQAPSKKSSASSSTSFGNLDYVIAENEAMLDELRSTEGISKLPDHPLEQNYILKKRIKQKASSSAGEKQRIPSSVSPQETTLTSSAFDTPMRGNRRTAAPERTMSNMRIAVNPAPYGEETPSPATPSSPSVMLPSTPGVPYAPRSPRTKSKAPAKMKIVAPTHRQAIKIRGAYLLIQNDLEDMQEQLNNASQQLRTSNAAVRNLGGRFKYLQGVIGKALEGVDWEEAESVVNKGRK